jgi:hypothetical protein
VFCCQQDSRFPTSTPSSLTITISKRERGGREKKRAIISCNANDLQMFVGVLGVRVRVIVRVVFVLIINRCKLLMSH